MHKLFVISTWRLCFLLFNAVVLPSVAVADDWPQWRGPSRDGVWKETGVIETFPTGNLSPAWVASVSAGFSGPTVAEGKVFVTDRVAQPKEVERVLCFDQKTGKPLWSYSYDCPYKVDYSQGPRAAVTIDDGRGYALGTMADIHCLDTATGKVIWGKDLKKEFYVEVPVWGMAAAPLVHKDLLILHIGAPNKACIVALDKITGEEKWRALDEPASYSAPILVTQAGKEVLVCWTGMSLTGLDPSNGQVLWAVPFKPSRMVLNVATPVWDGDRLFVSAFYDGSLMLRLLQDKIGVEEVWRRKGKNEQKTDSLHSIISTPVLDGAYIYGVDSYGEMRCLGASTGDRIWENLAAVPNVRWGTIHFVRNGDRYWLFTENGELIIAQLSPSGFREISRARVIQPTTAMSQRETPICWAHPAYADRHIFARSDKELVCVNLAAE